MTLRKIFIAILITFMNITMAFAESASIEFSINLPSYLQIQSSNTVLIANITDKTGNLYSPLTSRFRVISNNSEVQTLYLNSTVITENGNEDSMFEQGGRIYVAFTNIANKPKSQSLANCRLCAHPKESPGVVAYPITSILGAKSKYNTGKNRYEVYVENGITNISVNIGSNVLRNSFDDNDPRGFYQATLSLTETDL